MEPTRLENCGTNLYEQHYTPPIGPRRSSSQKGTTHTQAANFVNRDLQHVKTHFLKVVKRVRAVPDSAAPPAAVGGDGGDGLRGGAAAATV